MIGFVSWITGRMEDGLGSGGRSAAEAGRKLEPFSQNMVLGLAASALLESL